MLKVFLTTAALVATAAAADAGSLPLREFNDLLASQDKIELPAPITPEQFKTAWNDFVTLLTTENDNKVDHVCSPTRIPRAGEPSPPVNCETQWIGKVKEGLGSKVLVVMIRNDDKQHAKICVSKSGLEFSTTGDDRRFCLYEDGIFHREVEDLGRWYIVE